MDNSHLFQGVMVQSVIVLLMLMTLSVSSFAMDADFTGYARGGAGLNFEGGQQECFFNSEIPNNFMRLGNECGFYAELAFRFHHKKASSGDPVYFSTQVRWGMQSKGTRQWESAANRDVSQLEAFVKAGGFTEISGDLWIGKRFYRDVDLHIFDWYYYADMSGVGAGIENIPLSEGTFSLAHLIQGNDDVTGTTVGRPVLQAVDLRWKDLPTFAEQKFNVWSVFAWAPESSDATKTYRSNQGYSLATRLQGGLGRGNNNLTLMYGKGAMKDFNIYAKSALPESEERENKAWTVRVIEEWHMDVTERWAFMLGVAAESADNGASVNNGRHWQEVGLRPIYYSTDHLQWVYEVGYSHINNEAELKSGSHVGDRELVRVTVAPQLSLSKSIWGRPVMRMFLSHSFWNTANQSYVGKEAPTFIGKTEGTSFGYQFESWF